MKDMLLTAMSLVLLAVHVPHRCRVAAAEKSRSLPAPRNDVAEERALGSLARRVQVNFIEMSLSDALPFLAEFQTVKIRLDADAVNRAKIPTDSPVTLTREQDPFQRILNLIAVPDRRTVLHQLRPGSAPIRSRNVAPGLQRIRRSVREAVSSGPLGRSKSCTSRDVAQGSL